MIKETGLAVVLLLVFSGPAHAYIDPGTGTFLVQILAAFFLARCFICAASENFLRA